MNPTNYLNCYPISEASSFGYRTTSVIPSRTVVTTSVAGVNNSSLYYNSPVIPEPITSPPFFSPLPHPLSFYTTCRPPFSAKSLGGVQQLQQPQQQGSDEAAAVLLSLRQPVVRQGEEVPVFSFPMSQVTTDVKSTPSTPQLGSSFLYKPAIKPDLCQESSGNSVSSHQEYCSYHLPNFSSLPASYDPVFSRPMTAPYFLHNQGFLKANICYICGKSYARPSTLRTHLRTHSGEKPYQCSMCLKSFTQAANLTAHLRTHSGEKPFKCPVCERRFSQSSSVTTHMRTHSGERPYKCTVCSKAFADSSTLTKHFRTHSGEKPYQCKVCDAAFSQSGNLNRHMKIHRPRDSTPQATPSTSQDTVTQVQQ